MPSITSLSRLYYLDWLRGLAAVIMLQGHVFHSFLKPELRGGSAYVLSQFVGGLPPAIFLFLTGITYAFLMDSTERKGWSAALRMRAALRRAGYLFVLAFAFRLQLWLFGLPHSPWTDLLKVDILNLMGFAMALMSAMALFSTADRIRLCTVLGLGIAAAAPLISQLNWSGVPAVVKAYLAPDYNSFGFFPWGAFLAFGISAGSVIRILKPEHMDRAMQWVFLMGLALIGACHYFSGLPYSLYSSSEYWLNSPAQVLTKLGVILVMLPVAYLWTSYGARQGWSWIRQFGTTSLLVYWVHIELVYGRWLYFWKENLDVGQTTAAAVAVILLMLLISLVKTHRDRFRTIIAGFRWGLSPAPDRVSGD